MEPRARLPYTLPMTRRPEPDPIARLPIVFEVGTHKVTVTLGANWSWSCTVDTAPVEGWFMTQVEAWEAGVHEADRLDRAAGG